MGKAGQLTLGSRGVDASPQLVGLSQAVFPFIARALGWSAGVSERVLRHGPSERALVHSEKGRSPVE